MAWLQCRACDFDGEISWDGELVCPRCRSTDCRAAVETAEMHDFELQRIEASMRGSSPEDDAD